MSKVAILVDQNPALFELGCAVELFGLKRPEFEHWYEAEVVSFQQGPFDAASGLVLQARQVSDLADYDVLVVPSWSVQARAVPAAMAEAIKAFQQAGRRILSFCSGAFLLAELGLFDGKNATTHWRYAQLFKQRFSQVNYVDDVLYVYDGQLGCSAGSSAAIDLGLAVIRDDYGHQLANHVARRLVLSAHRDGGQAQFAETPVPSASKQFVHALDWAVQHLDQPLDIDALAVKANMSRRTFDRKFRADFNLSPKQWLTLQRIDLAKSLLEERGYSIDQVAEYAGFENANTLRHHFRQVLGVSPNSYRKQFIRQLSA